MGATTDLRKVIYVRPAPRIPRNPGHRRSGAIDLCQHAKTGRPV